MDKTLELNGSDLMVRFHVVNFFPSVPVDKSLNTVRALLDKDHSLVSRTIFSVSKILELLTVCVRSVYFWYKDRFYTQKEGLPWVHLCPLYWLCLLYTSRCV